MESCLALCFKMRLILAIPKHMNIGFAARLGYPVSVAESYLRVRRKIRGFTHRNRYSIGEHDVGDGVA